MFALIHNSLGLLMFSVCVSWSAAPYLGLKIEHWLSLVLAEPHCFQAKYCDGQGKILQPVHSKILLSNPSVYKASYHILFLCCPTSYYSY